MLTIIHIGPDKTGTTSIQYTLDALRQDLIEEGVAYPNSPSFGHHHADLAQEFGFSWGIPFPKTRVEDRGIYYIKEMQNSERRFILSSEHFSFVTNKKSIIDLKYWLQLIRPQSPIIVVIYLRNQISWLRSAYSEAIKWGTKLSLAQFYAATRYRMDLSEQISLWSDVFGREHIRAIDYDRHSKDAVTPLLNTLCVSERLQNKAQLFTVPFSNLTPPAALLEILRTTDFVSKGNEFYAFVANKVYENIHFGIYDLGSEWTWPLPEAFLSDVKRFHTSNCSIAKEFGLVEAKFTQLHQLLEVSVGTDQAISQIVVDQVRSRLLQDETDYLAAVLSNQPKAGNWTRPVAADVVPSEP